MKYELSKIEMQIDDFISIATKVSKTERKINLTAFKNEVILETERIRKSIIDTVFGLSDEKLIERYIQNHQLVLVRLSDKLMNKVSPRQFKNIGNKTNINLLLDLQYHIFSSLEELLSFIECYFSTFFNRDAFIPTKYRIIAQLEFNNKLKDFELDNECEIKEIALSPLRDFVNSKQNITFKNLMYLKELEKEVRKDYVRCKKCLNDNCKIFKKLLYLNFNENRFINSQIQRIKTDYKNKSDIVAQIKCLSYHLKKVKQVRQKPNVTYKQLDFSAKQAIINWATEEVTYLERVHQYSLEFPDKTIEEIKERFEFKPETNMSVEQHGAFVRCLVDAGIFIKDKNTTQLIEFFASNFKTKQKSNISPKSFKNAYYKFNKKDLNIVKEHIIEMLNVVNSLPA